jgi:microcystin-dependent protein
MAIDFPDFPTLNQVFNDPASGRYWRWDGEKWLSFDAGLSDTASLSLSEIPPLFPEPGDLWFESDTTRFFVYFDGAWVEIQGGNPGIQGPEGPAGNTPTGVINQFAGSSAPSGYVLCDGTAYNRTDPLYASLYSVIGTTYGVGNGSTTFNVPNLKGRVPVGLDTSQTEFDAQGKTGGSKISTAPHTHTIGHGHGSSKSGSISVSVTGGGAHEHRITESLHGAGTATTRVLGGQGEAGNTGSNTGNALPHTGHTHTVSASDTISFSVTNAPSSTPSGDSSVQTTSGNLQPYIALNYIIKL